MSNAAVSRYLSFIITLERLSPTTAASRVRQRAGVCAHVFSPPYLMILPTLRELIESFQYRLLAVFKCLLNTVFGGSAECSNEMWEMCDFIILCSHNQLTLRLQPALEKMQVWKASPAIVKFHTESISMCIWTHACWVPCSACALSFHTLIFFFLRLLLIRSLCPQVRVWLLIPWAAVLLNLQHMIRKRSPVKLNHSLLWPLINIQRGTKSLSWSASTLPSAVYRKCEYNLLPLYKQNTLLWEFKCSPTS